MGKAKKRVFVNRKNRANILKAKKIIASNIEVLRKLEQANEN